MAPADWAMSRYARRHMDVHMGTPSIRHVREPLAMSASEWERTDQPVRARHRWHPGRLGLPPIAAATCALAADQSQSLSRRLQAELRG
jgi:hypothetical protein